MMISNVAFGDLRETFTREGIVQLKGGSIVQSDTIQSIAHNVIHNIENEKIDRTYETVKVMKKFQNEVVQRKVLTRVENFVSTHRGWSSLCGADGPLATIIGVICNDDGNNDPWCLYKEKLNIKPAGGTGYQPHLDGPSLMVTGLGDHFITVMIAIDDMTTENGCLQVARGNYSQETCVKFETPDPTPTPAGEGGLKGGGGSGGLDPDSEGRRGSICQVEANKLCWEDVTCKSGDVYIFSSWLPHRSGPNKTQCPRRSVFLTYNPPDDG